MRKRSLDMVYELAKKDERIVFIGSDLGAGTLDNFRTEIPNRFFMEGVSEANIVGMAAGMALEGRIVYVNTIATFLTRRCFEQDFEFSCRINFCNRAGSLFCRWNADRLNQSWYSGCQHVEDHSYRHR